MKRNTFPIIITTSFFMIIFLGAANTPLLFAQSSFEFPTKIKYKVFKNDQLIGKAALFYTEEIGIKRYNRELSSLRWVIFQESENDFQYMLESYIFRDDGSLYSDSVITNNQVTSRIKLINYDKRSSNVSYEHTKFPGDTPGLIIVNNYKGISQISSILAASKEMAHNRFKYRPAEDFNYISTDISARANLLYLKEELMLLQGRKILVKNAALSQGKMELHRFKIFNDPNGYSFPVSIIFNVNNDHRLEMIMDEFPDTSVFRETGRLTAVFLDFIEANTRSLENRNEVENMVYNTILTTIEEKFNRVNITGGKPVILDNENQIRLNTGFNINQLINITFDNYLPYKSKIRKIVDQLKIPAYIDIIVTGQYVDNPQSSWLMVRPVMIFKSSQRIITKNLLFRRDKLLCRTPLSNKKILCPNARHYIDDKVEEFFAQLDEYTRGSQEQGLIFEDIYRMIAENRFFCHPVDYGYHFQVLEGLLKSGRIKNREFQSGREKESERAPGRDYIIKTISVNRENLGDVITLYWDPLPLLEGKMRTYSEAVEMMKQLNEMNYQGYSDWRIPTINELFSIAGDDMHTHQFFPFDNAKKNMKIWTSNLLKEKERQCLCFCETEAYFVINCIHNDLTHQLYFDIACENDDAFVLPVRSAINPWRQYLKPGQNSKSLSIASLAFMKTSDRSPMPSSGVGKWINKAVLKGMNRAEQANKMLEVKNDTTGKLNTDYNANQLANVFFDPNLTREQKINRIIQDLMNPNQVDLMVTGYFIDDDSSDMVTVRPIVIYKYNREIQTENLQFRKTEFECQGPSTGQTSLCQQAADQITNAVKILLERS